MERIYVNVGLDLECTVAGVVIAEPQGMWCDFESKSVARTSCDGT